MFCHLLCAGMILNISNSGVQTALFHLLRHNLTTHPSKKDTPCPALSAESPPVLTLSTRRWKKTKTHTGRPPSSVCLCIIRGCLRFAVITLAAYFKRVQIKKHSRYHLSVNANVNANTPRTLLPAKAQFFARVKSHATA